MLFAISLLIFLYLFLFFFCFHSTIQYGPRYDWDVNEQSLVLSAFFWGYVLTQIPGGVLADWIGGRSVIGVALALSALATLFIPLAAEYSIYAVCALRFIIGLVEVKNQIIEILFSLFFSDIFLFSLFVFLNESLTGRHIPGHTESDIKMVTS